VQEVWRNSLAEDKTKAAGEAREQELRECLFGRNIPEHSCWGVCTSHPFSSLASRFKVPGVNPLAERRKHVCLLAVWGSEKQDQAPSAFVIGGRHLEFML